MSDAPQPVIVYSSPLCGPCERLKAFLRARGVAFTVKDVLMDEAAADYLESRNVRTTPVLRVGDELVVGFRPDQVGALLERRARAADSVPSSSRRGEEAS